MQKRITDYMTDLVRDSWSEILEEVIKEPEGDINCYGGKVAFCVTDPETRLDYLNPWFRKELSVLVSELLDLHKPLWGDDEIYLLAIAKDFEKQAKRIRSAIAKSKQHKHAN